MRKKSHSAKKSKGGPLVFSRFVSYVKKVKNERGGPLETKKIEKSHSAEKNRKRDSLVASSFVGYFEKK